MAAPVLDLTTLVERPQIAIDGTRYEILSPDELSLTALERLRVMGRRIDELGRNADPSPDDEAELVKAVDAVAAQIMVGVPDDVRAGLSVTNMMRVIEVFIGLLPGRARRQAGATTTESPSIGAKPQPASSASTAATQAGGSPKPRSPSSEPI